MRTRLMLSVTAIVAATSADAMPNFARREGFDCTVCHTTIPRLNRFGFAYRNSGFRPPEIIGDPKQPNLPDFGTMNSARLQSQPSWVRTRTGTTTRDREQISFFETTLYPLTGAFGRWWSSLGEISFAPGEGFEVENAYLRATFGGAMTRFNVRAGVFHPWEGYGASDRPITLNRTLFQTVPARYGAGTGTTFFTPWNFDQAGVEAGYTFGGFNIAASVFNGIFVHEEEGAFVADPFQGGALSRPNGDPNYNSKDVQLFANQFFGDAALSAYYYHGRFTVPTGTPTLPGPEFTDKFDRVAAYATLPVPRMGPGAVPPLWLLAGYEAGWDTGFTGVTTTTKVRSQGAFGEVWAPVTPMVGAAIRYDWFDPSNKSGKNQQHAVVGALNVAALNGAQGILEYRHRLNEGATAAGATRNTNTDELRLRIIYIF